MRTMVLSILVENTTGVLSRVAGLFTRRAFNIDSLTVGTTDDPSLSRMTVVARGNEDELNQICSQLSKLQDVRQIRLLEDNASVTRELVLVSVGASAEERPQVISIADIFRAKIVDVSENSVMLELTGNQAKLTAFMNLLSKYKILKVARTGVTGLPRGSVSSDTELFNR